MTRTKRNGDIESSQAYQGVLEIPLDLLNIYPDLGMQAPPYADVGENRVEGNVS